jgi:hypothetical protein
MSEYVVLVTVVLVAGYMLGSKDAAATTAPTRAAATVAWTPVPTSAPMPWAAFTATTAWPTAAPAPWATMPVAALVCGRQLGRATPTLQLMLLSRAPLSATRWQSASTFGCESKFDRMLVPTLAAELTEPCVVMSARYDRRPVAACKVVQPGRGLLLLDAIYMGDAAGTRVTLYLHHREGRARVQYTCCSGKTTDLWLSLGDTPTGCVAVCFTQRTVRAVCFGAGENGAKFFSRTVDQASAEIKPSALLLQSVNVAPTAEDEPCDAATDAAFVRGNASEARAVLLDLFAPDEPAAAAIDWLLP